MGDGTMFVRLQITNNIRKAEAKLRQKQIHRIQLHFNSQVSYLSCFLSFH